MDWLDAFREHLTDVKDYVLNPPATPKEVEETESFLASQKRVKGFQLPHSYQSFLLRYNGGSLYDSWGDEAETKEMPKEDEEGGWIDVRFLSVGVGNNPMGDFEEYNAPDSVFMDHEIETYFNFEPLVIFAMDTGGSFWAFDPRLARPDGEMPVCFCDHETGKVYEQSDSFVAFMEGLTRRQVKVGSYGDKLPDAVNME